LRGTSFSQGWLDANGIRTRYLQSGSAGMPPLLLLHGVGGHAEAYARNLKSHGEHFWTWAIDLIGHGWTDKPAVDREIPQYIDHVLRVLDTLKVDKVSISGESLGGWVASRLAADHPDRVTRLVLNTAGGSQADPKVMERLKSLSMKAALEPSWDFIKARVEWLMADKSKAYDDLVACRQAIYAQPGMAEAMKHNMVLQDLDIRTRNLMRAEDYGRIKAPTLVLWTSDDPTADVSEGRRIHGMIPGSLFTVMEGCGHWPQFEDADTFNRLHLNFLRGRPLDAL
jgi:2-hydroxy-6-oxonona-2,4-dienedioate hydrolase